MSQDRTVALHYGLHGLREQVQAALLAAGLGEGRVSPAELAPLDQFHTRGLAATADLAEVVGIDKDTRVLDIGSGLGGPSRFLATTFGCHVVGLDLSPSFVEAATYLAQRAGLDDMVTYECGDALSLPYSNGSFDLAWTQHVAMNISDRARLYAQTYRVLRPGGRFAIYDVVAGNGDPLHFPVPWSQGPETSFLVTATGMRDTLEQQGFRVRSWVDRTDAGIAWFVQRQKTQAQPPAAPPSLGLNIAMGPDFPNMVANLGRNLREGRVGIIEAVLERPQPSP